jgi:membrane-associated HD superfamily phosphohydrolase
MIFLRRQLPLLITMITGLIFAAQYYVPHPASEQLLTSVTKWLQIIGGFALVLGITSLFQLHAAKIRRKESGWGYSLVLYAGIVITVLVGLWNGGKETIDGAATAFGWIYSYTLVPLQGTMFAILAFFIASAAYRSFRARSREAAVLLVAAVIVMMGRVPLGEYMVPITGDLSGWILNVLNAAVRRAILIGVSLGAIALSFKIIFGVERSYLCGGGE